MINILNYEPMAKGKLIGYVDVSVPKWGLTFRRIPHFQSEGKKWFNFPCYPQELENGSKKYLPYVSFDAKMNTEKFFNVVADEVKKFCEKHKIADPAPVDFAEECPF